jgi:hypothetical protein
MVNFVRQLASQKLGRWLTPNEVVVQADGERGNCAPGNLLVFSCAELARLIHQVERVLLWSDSAIAHDLIEHLES